MKKIKDLKIKIFLDGASIEDLRRFADLDYIKGFTTNPTLMKKAGVINYQKFIEEALPLVKQKPISFEVISDEFEEMRAQAISLSKFASNIYVKIPVMNTKGISTASLIADLTEEGIKINVTAMMTLEQIEDLARVLSKKTPIIFSIFAGRIADTGVEPVLIFKKARKILKDFKNIELLWASPRELLNIFQAEAAGCDIITVTAEILAKFHLIGYDLNKFSLDTVRQFYQDAISSGLKIEDKPWK
ncbi:MAG: transaldolase [Candidatus Omnitrophica bacterium]|nr:transaldolase [Candidatus Omnitrophota bacterium]